VGDHDVLANGSLLIALGILVTGLLALLFRHPRAPRWTRPELVAMLLVVPVSATLGLGLGYVLVGIYQLLHGLGNPVDLASLVVVALAAAAWWLVISRRLRAYDAVQAPNPAAAVSDGSGSVLADGQPRAQPPGATAHRSTSRAA
jgi:hypothetical protein